LPTSHGGCPRLALEAFERGCVKRIENLAQQRIINLLFGASGKS
jgi:hypothetical protein